MATHGFVVRIFIFIFTAASAEKALDDNGLAEISETNWIIDDYSDLLGEVNAAWTGHMAKDFVRRAGEQLSQTQADLAPILATLTRDENDHYEPSAVRYALHHYFVRKFGWHLKGLDPAGSAWNSTAPALATVLALLPHSLQAILARRLRVVGLDARGTAIFALLLKHLIHADGSARLVQAYAFLNFDVEEPLAPEPAKSVLDTYMAAFVVDRDLSVVEHDKFVKVFNTLEAVYPRWPELKELDGRALDAKLSELRARSITGVNFAALNQARETADEEFGTWQAPECRDLKQLLLTKEQDGTGRTTLKDFYAAGLNGHFQFRESVDWLRQLGALDDSAQGSPRVIIENYVIGASNTVGSTAFHDIRCISDCEALYAQVERNFVAPGVVPDELAAFVAQLPSPTSPAHGLSPLQVHRLQEIAAEHSGFVPLAGRMFAQWMHHAYPRECPYPHVAGTTAPVDYFTKMRTLGAAKAKEELLSSTDTMTAFANQKTRKGVPVQMALWANQEELPSRFEDPTPRIWIRLQFGIVLLVFSLATAKVCSQACGVRRLAACTRAGKAIMI